MDPYGYFETKNERPLERLTVDGGFSRIIRTMGCVGDSLSSGEFEVTEPDGTVTYHDIYQQSWGQYFARMTGCTVFNMSRGGMTAKEYCQSFADEQGFWDSKYACQAYIVALGVNDLINEHQPCGTIADVDMSDYHNNRDSFAGYFGQILQRLKTLQKDAKVFLMTMPRENQSAENEARADAHAALMYDFAAAFSNTYVLDFRKYAPVYDEKFHRYYFLGGHMNPGGYLLTAQMVASYLDFIIRTHWDDFYGLGLIGEL